MSFYGHYKSSTVSETGCVKEFISKPQEHAIFIPQLQYECDLCQKTHGFRLLRSLTASTPRQRKELERYCENNKLEVDVSLPEKYR